MNRILIISNRLPISISKKRGKLIYKSSVGGLATGLSSIIGKTQDNLWIGWPGIEVELITDGEKQEIISHLANNNCYPVFLRRNDVKDFYEGFCNKTIWPLFHYFIQYTLFDKQLWNAYVSVNSAFAEAVINVANPDDIIWVHDYHLLLLPRLLRERLPDASIGFFLHIPFPSFEVFRIFPWRREILEGMLGADLLGFHTYDYVRHFISSIRRRLGYEESLGQIITDDRIIKVETHPMGIDYYRFAQAVDMPEVQKEIRKERRRSGDKKVIISVDRLDYTKGIVKRLESFDLFLEKYPEFREKVIFLLITAPSREGVEQYEILKCELEETVGRINGKHGTLDWMPVWYMYTVLPFNTLIALYAHADVALVTPLRDGMNLIAKEFLATKTDGTGVLVLSEMAGAAKELSEAIIVNPFNFEEVADSIARALTMPEKIQIDHNREMQKRLQRYSVQHWAEKFIHELIEVKKKQKDLWVSKLTSAIREQLQHDYSTSAQRLIILDYDGTLRPFETKPSQAVPGEKLLSLLKRLSEDSKNDVLIISGRDKEILEQWFEGIVSALIAEHGVWIKEKDTEWEMIEPLLSNWKDDIRPVLEHFMDRTPGSFIEEKDFSLVWHYRGSDPEQTKIRAHELKDSLMELTANLGLGVLEGSKVIEVKNLEFNKGRAVFRWISQKNYDFILAAGDDWTDEDIFDILDDRAYSIKVGLGISKARFRVDSYKEIVSLLEFLTGGSDAQT